MTARVVRPARIKCRSGKCSATATLRVTAEHLGQPVDRCEDHLGEYAGAALWALAQDGHKAEIRVTQISREG